MPKWHVQMVLFSLLSLMDTADDYRQAMKRLVRGRHRLLTRSIGFTPERDPESADYYTELHIETIGTALYGRDFVDWLMGQFDVLGSALPDGTGRQASGTGTIDDALLLGLLLYVTL